MSNASDFCPWCRLALPTFQFAFMWVDYMACTPWCLGSSTHQVSESFDQSFGFSLTQGLVSGHRLEHCNRLSQMRQTATLCVALHRCSCAGIPRQLLNVLQGSQRKDSIPGERAGQCLLCNRSTEVWCPWLLSRTALYCQVAWVPTCHV